MQANLLYARLLLEAVEERRSQAARLEHTVAYLNTRAVSVTAHYTQGPGGSTQDRDGLLAELADRQAQLVRCRQGLQTLLQTLECWIDLLPKPRWRMVLRYHYLEALDLQDTCCRMSLDAGHCFSMSQIYRLHRQALLAAEALWPRNELLSLLGRTAAPTTCCPSPDTRAATEPPRAASAAGPGLRAAERAGSRPPL